MSAMGGDVGFSHPFDNFWLGNVNDDVDFHYEGGTKVEFGCGATFMDQFYYFGGQDSKKRQVRGSSWDSLYTNVWFDVFKKKYWRSKLNIG